MKAQGKNKTAISSENRNEKLKPLKKTNQKMLLIH